MEYSDSEIKSIIKKVVTEAKSSANVDTGFLKRSIRGNLFRGKVTFREVFYGAYNDNSKLVDIAKRLMPKEIDWEVIFVDEEGRETPIEGKTKTGRKISRKSITSGNVSTSKIKQLIQSIKASGKEKDDTRKGDRETND